MVMELGIEILISAAGAGIHANVILIGNSEMASTQNCLRSGIISE